MSDTPDISVITAAVLAGGLGTRLGTAVSDRPKSLAPVLGRPFLAYLLDMLSMQGIKHAVLCTGFLGEMIEKEFGGFYRGMEISYSPENSPLGTGGALALAEPMLRSETVLALNGDSYCAIDLVQFLKNHVEKGAEASLALVHVDDTSRYGRVETDSNGMVTGFAEKSEVSGPGFINAGIYILNRNILSSLSAGKPVSIERDVFPSLAGKSLYGFLSNSPFIDIGTPESFHEAERFFSGMDAELR